MQHRLRNRQADLLGGREIDDELEFSRLFHGEISGFDIFQNFVHKCWGAAKQLILICGMLRVLGLLLLLCVAHQSSSTAEPSRLCRG
jgi:hypothetical protein